ncbi:DNA-methyltransferase [Halalkalicoccus subterraneus]|uniref:DNA-methyltransferase n=1 Tax=Halalkalicoccus subterraneus TaxID=2675002 RepID=UPI000EFB23A5|nr:site-specific DNA-methyltransferase [Halalkalicoccus subterraneus]
MRTEHTLRAADARDLALAEGSVDLVVTSPPYPMIEMWDEAFSSLDPEVEAALNAEEDDRAFELMHGVLDSVWDRLECVLREGGIACINVGDATRTVENTFQTYPNHVRITEAFRERGFVSLPGILWRKPTNSAAKFMGSGMVPTNAYPTLEHEHILVFRKGGPRRFEPHSEARYESAYFWEERNRWFSDLWSDVRGVDQRLDSETRERSGAFPFELPYRLINMFSVHCDTVCDPFWGTGTTTLAAMVAGRNSVGYELDPELIGRFDDRIEDLSTFSQEVLEGRLAAHREFVERVGADDLSYDATHYDFPVRTKQEREIRLYSVEGVGERGETDDNGSGYRVEYRPFEGSE